jgi:uncharacterized coiled-coil protein SlyX
MSAQASAADTIRELEDELWEREKCVKRIMEEIDSQLTEFRKVIQAKNKIISELEKKLAVQNRK